MPEGPVARERAATVRTGTPANAQMQSMGGDPDATMDMDELGDLEWDDIVPGDLLEDEQSLRETVQMDREPESTRLSIPAAEGGGGEGDEGPAEDMESLRKTVPSSKGNGLGKAITGESVTRTSTPQAQVLKRTKLVVGERKDFEDEEHTRDVQPIKKSKSDSTLELDIEDDNVEEIN